MVTSETYPMSRARKRKVAPHAVLALALLGMGILLTSCATSSDTRPVSSARSVTVITTATPGTTPATSTFSPARTPTKVGYRLVFDDEFVGPTLDPKWMPSLPWGNTNRAELEYYTPANLSQDAGVLTLTARQQNLHGKPYTSGAINSSKSYSFTYGWIETRAQIPSGQGLWSAFWLGTMVRGLNDEIDIMEILGSDPSRGYAVLHYGTATDRKASIVPYLGPDFSAGFHTFAVDWEPDALVWYVDGVEKRRITQNIPSHPMCIITSLTVGGQKSWSGPPNKYTVFPADLNVDYIRVFQH